MKVSAPILFLCEDMINISEILCVVSQCGLELAHHILDSDLLGRWV
jgi:hypothetical protein